MPQAVIFRISSPSSRKVLESCTQPMGSSIVTRASFVVSLDSTTKVYNYILPKLHQKLDCSKTGLIVLIISLSKRI